MKKKHLTGLIILASLSIPSCAENNTKDSHVNTGENIENNINGILSRSRQTSLSTLP